MVSGHWFLVEENGKFEQAKTLNRNLLITHLNKVILFYTKKDILLQYKNFFAKLSF